MSITIDVFDGSQSFLENILEISYTSALESLSVAGSKLRDAQRKAMKSKTTRIIKDYSGKNPVYKFDGTQAQELGLMMAQGSSENGSANPKSMSSMIGSYVNKKRLLVVVGGKYPTHIPTAYDNGKVSGRTLKEVKGVGKRSQAILHKLNTGEEGEFYKRDIAGMKFKGYNFMQEGYANAKSEIQASLTKRYVALLSRNIDSANTTIKKKKVI